MSCKTEDQEFSLKPCLWLSTEQVEWNQGSFWNEDLKKSKLWSKWDLRHTKSLQTKFESLDLWKKSCSSSCGSLGNKFKFRMNPLGSSTTHLMQPRPPSTPKKSAWFHFENNMNKSICFNYTKACMSSSTTLEWVSFDFWVPCPQTSSRTACIVEEHPDLATLFRRHWP